MNEARARPPAPSEDIGFGLPRRCRLLSARDFRRVYGRGQRAGSQQLVVVALPRRGPGHRLGVSVSKDHGPAVIRNKIKRLLREAFRLERPDLPGRYDMVLIPRPRDSKFALDALRQDLCALVRRIDAGEGKRRRPRTGGRGGKGKKRRPRGSQK